MKELNFPDGIKAAFILFSIGCSLNRNNVDKESDKIVSTCFLDDSMHIASFKYNSNSNNYRLNIKKLNQNIGSTIFDSAIFTKGYHEPIIHLSWEKNEKVFEVSIDHDFGDGIIKFSFNPNTKILSEIVR